jgi:hypothetical protein
VRPVVSVLLEFLLPTAGDYLKQGVVSMCYFSALLQGGRAVRSLPGCHAVVETGPRL